MTKKGAEVWVVTSKFALLGIIETILPDRKIWVFFRDYHFEDAVKAVLEGKTKKPDLILTDGTCKTRDEHGQSVGIYYDEPRKFGKENNIPVASIWITILKARAKRKILSLFH